MKRKLVVLSILLFTIFMTTGMSQAQGFRLKLTGGYGTVTTGDYNAFGDGMDRLLVIIEGLGASTEGEFNKINLGFEYEAEFILSLPQVASEHKQLKEIIGYGSILERGSIIRRISREIRLYLEPKWSELRRRQKRFIRKLKRRRPPPKSE